MAETYIATLDRLSTKLSERLNRCDTQINRIESPELSPMTSANP